MSTGGIFALITNDGKADRMIMATDLLRLRLSKVQQARRAAGQEETPTLNDIEKTHVLFMNAHFKPFAAIGYEYNKVSSSSGNATLGSDVSFSIPQFGDFFYDMALHVKLTSASISGGTTPTFRYCDYPGERLIQKCSFTVNGNPLDEYVPDDVVFRRLFHLPKDKVDGYNRCVGQENKIEGEFIQASGVAPIDSRIWGQYSDGPQTPRTTQADLEMVIPLQFWCNLDPRLAVPSVSIPYGQRFVEMTLATSAQLLAADNRGTSTGEAAGTITAPTVSVIELYINNIFVNPEVHDIYIKRVGFNLIRVHRRQSIRLTNAEDELLLNNLKWPIEYMHVGIRSTANDNTSGDPDGTLSTWWRLGDHTETDISGPLTTRTVLQTDTVDSMSILAHGITLYDNFPDLFFSSYLPYRHGNTVTPTDAQALFVPFCLHPGVYQPSGHVNVSRAREFYLKYVSSYVSTTNTADLLISASALNFLLISDGSAVLRYST